MAKGSHKRAKNVQPTSPPPSAAVVSPNSPSVSNSSGVEDFSDGDNQHPEDAYGASASRPASPSQNQPTAEDAEIEDAITCQWEECGVVFTHLPTLIDHIHNGKCSNTWKSPWLRPFYAMEGNATSFY
jgi:hypothetical protein